MTSPINMAVERDFNRFDVDGQEPDALEHAFGEFEGRAAQAIRNTSQTGAFPVGEDYDFILNILCLIAVRNPHLCKSFDLFREQEARTLAALLVSDQELFENCVSIWIGR